MATIYDGLIRYKPGTVEVEPGLAQSWDVSADALTYTFHLRKGVKFHDGTPFNAQALIATLDRQLKKDDPNYIGNYRPGAEPGRLHLWRRRVVSRRSTTARWSSR